MRLPDRLRTVGFWIIKSLGACGVSVARNIGIRESTGDVLAFLDDDDAWLPGKIDRQLANLVGEVIGVDCGDVEKDEKWGLEINVVGDGKCKSQREMLNGYCPTSASLVALKREVALSAGLFDERMRSFEDYDFWLRCAGFGKFGSCA